MIIIYAWVFNVMPDMKKWGKMCSYKKRQETSLGCAHILTFGNYANWEKTILDRYGIPIVKVSFMNN